MHLGVYSLMNQGKFVFSQLTSFLSVKVFNRCVSQYQGNRNVRGFRCWHQFLCLLFGQLTHRESLRDIVTCLVAQGSRLYHLGFPRHIARSTFADANERRDWRIYADFAQILMAEARQLYSAAPDISSDFKNPVYAFDASLIRICISVFPWANYRKTTAAIKLHTLLEVRTNLPQFVCITEGKLNEVTMMQKLFLEEGSFYVMDRGYWNLEELLRINDSGAFFLIRAKKSLRFSRRYSKSRESYPNILADQVGVFEVRSSRKLYPKKIRRIKSKDPETGKSIVLVTNHFDLDPATIAYVL